MLQYLCCSSSTVVAVAANSGVKGGKEEEPHTEETEHGIPKLVDIQPNLLDYKTPVHAGEIGYSVVTAVLKSWAVVTATHNYQEIGGEMLLRKVFQIAPSSCIMFGLPVDTVHDDPALSTNKGFVQQGANSLSALNEVISSLGPDLEPLENILFQLGGRHARYKCEPAHWIVVGDALLHVLEQVLGPEKFTYQCQRSWIVLYNFISFHMVRGLLAKMD